MNISIILSGGTGLRFGGSVPKQYAQLCGREVIGHVIDAVVKCHLSDKTIIVATTDEIPRLTDDYGIECVYAGKEHNHSVKNGLDYIKTKYPDCKKVLFVDSARPLVTSSEMDNAFNLLDSFDAVCTARFITDSLGHNEKIYVERAEYFLIQKPEAFNFKMLYAHFSADSPTTAIIQQMPQNARLKKTFSDSFNLKITYPDDLSLAEYLIGKRKE